MCVCASARVHSASVYISKANCFRVMKYLLLNDLGYICNDWCFYKKALIAIYMAGT